MLLFLLAMNINWTEHGHPGNYVVRERTLIKAVNDYLDILNMSGDPYDSFASHLTALGFIEEESDGYQFTAIRTPARKRDLHHLPAALGSLARSNAKYRPNQLVYVLSGFKQEGQEVITALDPSKLRKMKQLLEDIR